MDLDAAGEQQAKTLFVAALAQEKIHETKVLAAKAQEEISDLNDQLEAQKEAKSKVFAYLNEKLADSYDQIKELEAKFDHDRRQSNSKRVMYKLQLNGLEHKQREERSSERRRQDALRQEVELLERYEQELPSLAARLEELKEAADAEAAKAEEYKKVIGEKFEKVKRKMNHEVLIRVKKAERDALKHHDTFLDPVTYAMIKENRHARIELAQQEVCTLEVEGRVRKIEEENSVLKRGLADARAAEQEVAKLLVSKQRRLARALCKHKHPDAQSGGGGHAGDSLVWTGGAGQASGQASGRQGRELERQGAEAATLQRAIGEAQTRLEECRGQMSGPVELGDPVVAIVLDALAQHREAVAAFDAQAAEAYGDIVDDTSTLHNPVIERQHFLDLLVQMLHRHQLEEGHLESRGLPPI
eukprot:CAMPEP_0172597488 /NCGR_PEP_ID=MMETSP1068-20121228/17495_1 /TAXON_ID=35684 /ORGANISM="Pseudopedinella elastica, Strain CCMP716" /LENGTH=414 /DNA_ID=CAMNT_0013397029 /DNA_START=158 /DNA_END=1402 /DNA_ORIENTATION=+